MKHTTGEPMYTKVNKFVEWEEKVQYDAIASGEGRVVYGLDQSRHVHLLNQHLRAPVWH